MNPLERIDAQEVLEQLNHGRSCADGGSESRPRRRVEELAVQETLALDVSLGGMERPVGDHVLPQLGDRP